MTEDFTIREMLEVLMGQDGKRKLRLRHKTNEELFASYDSQLVLKHSSRDALQEARRFLGHYRSFLGQYPPSPELAADFLAKFKDRKPNTLYRYHAIIQGFQTWYGERLDTKIKVPQTLPQYVEETELEKLKAGAANKKTHKKKIQRNLDIIELIGKTGLRAGEVANLRVRDVDLARRYLVARKGKEMKDRIVDLTSSIIPLLESHTKGKNPEDSVFGLSASSISYIVTSAAKKGGVKIHAHSLRDLFATRLVDRGTDLETVRRLLGHANLNTTQRYLGRTDEHRRAAIESLDLPVGAAPSETEARGDGQSPSGRGSISRSTTGGQQRAHNMPNKVGRRAEAVTVNETSHKTAVRQLAAELAGKIALPSLSDKELWRQLPLTSPGTYYLELGAVTVTGKGRSAVRYEAPCIGARPHLASSLGDHLRSSGMDRFSRLTGERSLISDWAMEVGHYSEAALSLLDAVIEKIRASGSKIRTVDSTRPGLTRWFAVTAWHDLIMTGGGHTWMNDTWYGAPEKAGQLFAVKCGAFDIARGTAFDVLVDNVNLHRRLRVDHELAAEASHLEDLRRELDGEGGRLCETLEEFSDLEIVPGSCALCAH